MLTNFITKCLLHLAKFKQLGNLNLSDQDVLKEYVVVFAEIDDKEELKQIFTELKSCRKSEFFPSLGRCKEAIGYKSTDEQQWLIAEEIKQYLMKKCTDSSKLRYATKYYYDKLGRSQGINFRSDDINHLSKLKKLIEIHWETTGPKLGRIGKNTNNMMLTEGNSEKKQ